jgi:hypothetical protein
MPNGTSPVKGRSGIEKFFQKDMADGVSSAQVGKNHFIRYLFFF